jgi:hypothetical protein
MSTEANFATLPVWVLRSPYIFYALAVIAFAATIGLGWMDASSQYQYAVDVGAENAMLKVKLRVFFEAFREAAYLLASGFALHISLAIWARLAKRSVSGASE